MSKLDFNGLGTNFEVLEEKGELEIGNDIIEIPNRNLLINVRYLHNSYHLIDIINELKKFGSLTLSDYVSYESFGNNIFKKLCREGDFIVAEVSQEYLEIM
ncbi:MAG: hypothetical protein AABX77_02655 [Nanoarchaeota archaeon]